MQTANEKSKVTRVGVVMYKFAYKNGVLYRKRYNLIKEDNNIGTFYDLPADCYTEEMIAFFDGGGRMTSNNVDKIVFYNGFENENFFAMISKDKSVDHYKRVIEQYMTANLFQNCDKKDFDFNFYKEFYNKLSNAEFIDLDTAPQNTYRNTFC